MMIKFSKIKKEGLAFWVATTTAGIITMVNFYCQKHNDLLCMNVAEEPSHQVQIAAGLKMKLVQNLSALSAKR